MKKQFFTLVMMLAIVVLAGTSAMAQQLGSPAVNNESNSYIMIAGSTKVLRTTPGQAADVPVWSLHDRTTGTVVPATIAAVSTNAAGTEFTINWTENSIGTYYAQVVETRSGNDATCQTTTRRFYITIIDFDVLVYAADENGAHITDLANCGNGTTARYGDIISGGANVAFSNAFHNVAGTNSDSLALLQGEISPQTQRYIGFQIIWNVGTSGLPAASLPTPSNILVDYTVKVDDKNSPTTYVDNTDLVSLHTVNGNAASGTNLQIDFPATAISSGYTPAADFNCLLTGSVAGPAAVIPVVINDRWSSAAVTDLTLDFEATNVRLNSVVASVTTQIGVEPDSYVKTDEAVAHSTCVTLASNFAQQQTIYLAPATSTITVAP